MRIFFAFILFIAVIIFGVVARWYFVCEMRQLCDDAPIEVEDLRLKTLQLTEGGTVLLDGYDHFAFDSSSFRVRLNDNNESFLDTLITFLGDDDVRKLRITGFGLENEAEYTGMQETLGAARAETIRDLLEKRGIDKESIEIRNEEMEGPWPIDKPISFELFQPDPEEYSAPVNTFFNMTYDGEANFKKNSDEFNPAAPLQLYADSVKLYFETHTDLKLTIIGHADSDGTSKYNERLGQRRADNAKAYFMNIGVPEERILTASKGEKEPILPNTSEKNMLKNRRVQFIIE